MKKTYYFMAGLPRSGSTLLSSILNQNPRFHSGPSSPVISIMLMLEDNISANELYLAYPKKQQVKELISDVINHYYSDVSNHVIFDKNRRWTSYVHYIQGYFGISPKIICPVRNIDEILASFIALHRRNPYETNGRINFIDEMLVKANIPLTDENRCRFLVGHDGIVGQSYNGIKHAIMEGREKQLHFLEYDDLVTEPEKTMRKLYDFLEEDNFKHDFINIENIHKERDLDVYGLADMHSVRKTISKADIDPKKLLPQNILNQCKGMEFWRNLKSINFDN